MDPSQTRNQTGPPNIAGGLEGEGNDLRSRHTSLEIETHHRRTDRRGGGERAPPFRFSPLCPHLKRNSNTDYAAPQPPTHPSSVCGTPPLQGAARGSFPSLPTLVHSWQLRALFLPQPPAQSPLRPLSPTRTLSLVSRASLPQGFWGSSISSQQGTPPGPLCPGCGLTPPPHSP